MEITVTSPLMELAFVAAAGLVVAIALWIAVALTAKASKELFGPIREYIRQSLEPVKTESEVFDAASRISDDNDAYITVRIGVSHYHTDSPDEKFIEVYTPDGAWEKFDNANDAIDFMHRTT